MRRTRRAVLRGAGAAVGTATVGGLAGCSSLPMLGDAGGDPWYPDRLPAPAVFETDFLEFSYHAWRELTSQWDRADPPVPEPLARAEGVSGADLEHKLSVTGRRDGTSVTVYAGAFHGRAVVDALPDDIEVSPVDDQVDAPSGYDIFAVGEEKPDLVAAADGAYVTLSPWRELNRYGVMADCLAVLEGRGSTYPAADAASEAMLDAVGAGDIVLGQRHVPYPYLSNAVGEAVGVSVGEATELEAAFAFESAEAATERPIRGWADRSSAVVMGEWVDVAAEERTVTLSTETDAALNTLWAVELPDPAEDFEEPAVEFYADLDRINAVRRGLVVVTHVGDLTIPADQVRIHGEGFAPVGRADQTEPGPWQGEISGSVAGKPAIAPGDAVSIGIESPHTIELSIDHAEGETGHLLRRGRV